MLIKMEGYIPQSQRKKILLMCDDIRTHSGIGTIAREIVLHLAHRYNIINVGAAINHPDQGKRLDISADTNATLGINDASVIIYPSNGYGNPDLVRQLIHIEKPDAIFIITDPRYWAWLFQMENEIRKKIPIVYLNIWDDYPSPMYNKEFYESCDLLMGISKQTVNINKLVLGDKAKDKIISYVPHGLNHKVYFPIDESYEKYDEFKEFKNQVFKGKEFDFVLFFNSRNIRRKQVPDTIWAYKQFVDKLPLEKAKKCALLLHTQPIDENGTDLPAVIEALCGDDERYNFIFSESRLTPLQMNYLYNCVDAQILLTSNEGWGLSLTEAILTGKPIIANVTGGMQDQMRFEDEKGLWIDFDDQFPSNHRGRYKKCGPWAFPVFPTSISIVGSVPTPYIFDDRCEASDAADRIFEVYNLGPDKRKAIGLVGREWAIGDEAKFTSEKMTYSIISNLDKLFQTWKPRKKYELIKVENKKPKIVPHNLIY
jgi:glycosyltransferase involved in cell wall biosynthesis